MIRPEEFLNLADRLAQDPSEAEWRTAASRAYYAAFPYARALLRDLKFQVPRAAQAHAYLWLRLANVSDPAVKLAGDDLNDLQSVRNRSDYDDHLVLRQMEAIQAIAKARTILQKLANVRVEPLRTQIRDSIRDYERYTLKVNTYQGP